MLNSCVVKNVPFDVETVARFLASLQTANYVVRAEDLPRAVPGRTIVYCLKTMARRASSARTLQSYPSGLLCLQSFPAEAARSETRAARATRATRAKIFIAETMSDSIISTFLGHRRHKNPLLFKIGHFLKFTRVARVFVLDL